MTKAARSADHNILLLILIFCTSGCANPYQEFKQHYEEGDFLAASQKITAVYPELMNDEQPTKAKDLLSALYIGSALQAAGKFTGSIQAFDIADQLLNWQSNTITSVSDFLGSLKELLLSGQLYRPAYTGHLYEGILVNTFKGMNYMYMGDFGKARVELNRAQARQNNAIEQLEYRTSAIGEIGTYQSKASKDTEDTKRQHHIQSVYTAIREEEALQRRLEAVRGLKQYEDLRNPLTDYIHGVFRLITGDFNQASDLLRNAQVLKENNPYILEDFKLAEQAAQSLEQTSIQRVWVIFEDGIGPYLTPLNIPYISYFGEQKIVSVFSLPTFNFGQRAWGSITIRADDNEYRTSSLLDVNEYAAFEFNANYNTILFKTVASVLMKRFLRYTGEQISKQESDIERIFGFLLNIFATLSEVTAIADTRSWDVLPHSVSIASMALPRNKVIEIKTIEKSQPVPLPDNDVVLIYVKAVNKWHPLRIYVSGFHSPYYDVFP